MVLLSPIIRLDTKDSFSVIEAVSLDLIVVRLQDLISKSSFKFNGLYTQIVTCGGLHKFLGFDKTILLSLIMKDEIIANFGPVRYAEAINSLRPDLFTTVDGETYDGEVWLSAKELKRINSENQQLLKLVSSSKPVGLVKGCTPTQIENHAKLLVTEGMDELIFHVGDFLRHHDFIMTKRARMFSLIIRKYAKSLILYGLGSPKRFLEFSFADRYVTYKHYILATKREKCFGTKRVKRRGPFDSQIVAHNFVQLCNIVKDLKSQRRLYSEG